MHNKHDSTPVLDSNQITRVSFFCNTFKFYYALSFKSSFFFTFLRASSKLACSQHSAIFVAEGKRTHQMLLRAILHTYCIVGVIFIRAHRTHATCNLCDPYCVLLITTVQEGCVHAMHALKDNTNLLAEVVGVVNDNAALIKLALQNIKCVL